MAILTGFLAERLITQIKDAGDLNLPKAKKALVKLNKMGDGVVPVLLDALQHADKDETVAYVEVLTQLISDKTLKHYVKALKGKDQRIISSVAWALTSNQDYDANKLVELLKEDDVNKPALIEILKHHKSQLKVRELLTMAYTLEPGEKAAMFRLVAEIADESMIPDLISRLHGKDPIAKVHLISILTRFNSPEIIKALEGQLSDNNKMVRQAALGGLGRMDSKIDIALLCSLLSDPEMEVANKAVELVIAQNDPDTVSHLVEVLKDESEFARRAAVEVLNEIGDENSIKDLLEVISDEDWWVRSRASDALGKIGGENVVDAVIKLVSDKDDDIRRAAIEILNITKHPRAVDHLIEATKDPDWWVSERAVDALAEIGSKKAIPALIEMTKGDHKGMPIIIRALGKLGNHKIISDILPLLNRPEKDIKIEAIHALAKLTDEARADTVRSHLTNATLNADATIIRAVNRALKNIDNQYSPTLIATGLKTQQFSDTAKTLLIDSEDVSAIVAAAEAEARTAQRLDITTLKPGDIIENRYKFIDQIGKGAFGTVLLVEDTVVDERLILKFLNANVSSDEEMMQRFVHELRYSRKITHKNVIRIYDFLHMGGHYAISMEYFASHTLGGEVVDEKPVERKKGINWAIDICTGMAVAHQVGIVHRDLKPANILINDEGLLKIVDFGVAAAQSSGDTQLTKTGYVIGSPKYMAPEQILGKKVDIRADIYSTGVILYELLCGVPPYSKGDHMAVMYQHVQGKARNLREVNKDIPAELSDLVEKSMSVDKMGRYDTMDDFRETLEAYLDTI